MKIQTTLRTNVSIEGIGLHTGKMVRVEFRPAGEDHGIVFHRSDAAGPAIPASPVSTRGFDHATTLGAGGLEVSTVEHVLSAAYGLGLDNMDVDVDGPELPILDGSALPFARLFLAAGIERQQRPIAPHVVARAVEIVSGDRAISAEPGRGLTIQYEIEFPHRAIGRQEFVFELSPDTYASRIAPARTFGLMSDIEQLRSRGLARGGSLSNAIVLDEENILSGPLRFPDEFVRHKILDLIGDLALLGRPIEGRIRARRAGHALHAAIVRKLAQPAQDSGAIPTSVRARG
jgi:UDP-3-O-[3-hydroxymyristoyl] N-acetylglucosamine deacetylase